MQESYFSSNAALKFVNVVPLKRHSFEVRIYVAEIDQSIQRNLMELVIGQEKCVNFCLKEIVQKLIELIVMKTCSY